MTRASTTWVWIAAIGALLVCSGCGFKGPLYLPEKSATVVTPPAKSKGKTSQRPQSSPAPSPPPASAAPSAPPSPPQ